jgi:hypothetical protein
LSDGYRRLDDALCPGVTHTSNILTRYLIFAYRSAPFATHALEVRCSAVRTVDSAPGKMIVRQYNGLFAVVADNSQFRLEGTFSSTAQEALIPWFLEGSA